MALEYENLTELEMIRLLSRRLERIIVGEEQQIKILKGDDGSWTMFFENIYDSQLAK